MCTLFPARPKQPLPTMPKAGSWGRQLCLCRALECIQLPASCLGACSCASRKCMHAMCVLCVLCARWAHGHTHARVQIDVHKWTHTDTFPPLSLPHPSLPFLLSSQTASPPMSCVPRAGCVKVDWHAHAHTAIHQKPKLPSGTCMVSILPLILCSMLFKQPANQPLFCLQRFIPLSHVCIALQCACVRVSLIQLRRRPSSARWMQASPSPKSTRPNWSSCSHAPSPSTGACVCVCVVVVVVVVVQTHAKS